MKTNDSSKATETERHTTCAHQGRRSPLRPRRRAPLRTIDVAGAPFERALDIADHAAQYISGRSNPQTDAQHARGCDAKIRDARLYVIRRAERLAEQHRGGQRFQMIETALDALADEDAETLAEAYALPNGLLVDVTDVRRV